MALKSQRLSDAQKWRRLQRWLRNETELTTLAHRAAMHRGYTNTMERMVGHANQIKNVQDQMARLSRPQPRPAQRKKR